MNTILFYPGGATGVKRVSLKRDDFSNNATLPKGCAGYMVVTNGKQYRTVTPAYPRGS
jgi:hypothetical protein